jgi:hypothetical protein
VRARGIEERSEKREENEKERGDMKEPHHSKLLPPYSSSHLSSIQEKKGDIELEEI